MDQDIQRWFAENSESIREISQKIFDKAETAFEERESAKITAEYLSSYGFTTEFGIAGLPTAFRSRAGQGQPVIGFLGEYDALPGLNQGKEPYFTGDSTKNGHGCGHNLLGAGAAAAAAALHSALRLQRKEGTIVFYGCPAEEVLEGKNKMLAAGAFRELDVALSWHPFNLNFAGKAKYQVMDSLEFAFQGLSAHAAIEPHLGRSALDACELMSVGVNYLREHVPEEVRMHYCYLNAGEKPNIVPGYARVLYYLRAKNRSTLDDVVARVRKVAEGAALMTGTAVTSKVLCSGSETVLNERLIRHLDGLMRQIELPEYTEEEKEFGITLAENINFPQVRGEFSKKIMPITGKAINLSGSTDLSGVSQIVPTGFVFVTCFPKETPLHHWACTACAGTSVGQKGMLYAAKVLAQCGYDLITQQSLLEEVKDDFCQACQK